MTVYYKRRQILLQNTTAMLLQNATEVYYKVRQVFYYKMRQLLQNVTFITDCHSTNIVTFSTAVVGTIVLEFSAGKLFTFMLFFLPLFSSAFISLFSDFCKHELVLCFPTAFVARIIHGTVIRNNVVFKQIKHSPFRFKISRL